jgi:hypothetical protein
MSIERHALRKEFLTADGRPHSTDLTVMARIAYLLVAVLALAGVVAFTAVSSGDVGGEPAPIFGVKIPAGYRDWTLISVAHEEGDLNDLRAILCNDIAIKAD